MPAGPGARARRRPAGRFAGTAGAVLLLVAFLIASAVSARPARADAGVGGAQVPAADRGLLGVACATSSTCEVVGGEGHLGVGAGPEGVAVTVTGGAPGSPHAVAGTPDLWTVACPTAGTCEAVGYADVGASEEGFVVTITDGIPGSVQLTDAYQLSGVACATASTCYAVGVSPSGEGVVVPITDGRVGGLWYASGTEALHAIACPTPGTCEAVGWDTDSSAPQGVVGAVVTLTDGAPGEPAYVPGTDYLWGVACPASGTCEVLYDSGAFILTGGSAGKLQQFSIDGLADLEPLGIACPGAGACVAVGSGVNESSANPDDWFDQGYVLPINDGTPGTAQVIPGNSYLEAVGCPASASTATYITCQAAGGEEISSSPVVDVGLVMPVTVTFTRPLSINTASLPGGAVRQDYSAMLSAAGGTPPYTWAVTSGNLPDGLSLDKYSGLISGRPTTAGSFSFTIHATDSSSPAETATEDYSLKVSALAISPESLPAAAVHKAFSAALSAADGTPPYTWSIAAGNLPKGLSLDSSTGVISGKPGRAGTSSFTIEVDDSSDPRLTGLRTYSLTILMTISPASLPTATLHSGYSAALSAAGGTATYNWSLSAGSLPAGMSLSVSGVISGKPGAVGTSHFTVEVTDSSRPALKAARTYSLTVAMAISPASLPKATINKNYSVQLSAAGGRAPYRWKLRSGTLPRGLSLSAAGVISGKPARAGTSKFTIEATDSSHPALTATKTYSLTTKT